jgi:hypothetical protein
VIQEFVVNNDGIVYLQVLSPDAKLEVTRTQLWELRAQDRRAARDHGDEEAKEFHGV